MDQKVKLIRTNSNNKDFRKLVNLLDEELKTYDGDQHEFYHQYNSIEQINNVLVLSLNDEVVACGAFKQFNKESVEIKRMYTLPNHRGKSLAKSILKELEIWSKELGFKSCILETGKKQKAAIKLYESEGYLIIQNYGPYQGVDNSLCFEKKITPHV